MTLKGLSPNIYWRFLFISILIIGILFRFNNLDLKIYWVDEVINTHYAAGYTEQEIGEQVKSWYGQTIKAQDILKYQSIDPNKNSIDVIKSLAVEEPQSPPLYYLILRWWMQLFGDSVAARRSLSACLSLLLFPAIYWFCLELFGSSLVGWIAVVLVAVSPFHVLYAQEVRYYSVWTVFVALCCAAFFRAIRHKTRQSWSIYTSILILGLYTYPLTALIAIGQGIYLLFLERFRFTQRTLSFAFSQLIAVIIFSPWLFFIFTNSHKISDWRKRQIGISQLVRKWIFCFKVPFFDLGQENLSNSLIEKIILFLLIFIIGYSLYCVCRNSPSKYWLFIFLVISFNWSMFALPDLLTGGIRSTIPRYLIPSYLLIQIAIAYLLANWMSSTKIWQNKLGVLTLILTISLGLYSCVVMSQSQIWWSKGHNQNNPELANIINNYENPLLISKLTSDDGRSLISLSYLLANNVSLLLLYDDLNVPPIANNFSEFFLFKPTEQLKETINLRYTVAAEPIDRKTRDIWQITSH